jgi:hypothetical protein
MNHIKSNTNVCIKAFAGPASQTGDPEICISPTQMNFTAIIGGTVTGSQNFGVSNCGNGTLNWTLSDNVNWLNYSSTAGTNYGEVTVSADASGLAAGSYTGTINIIDPNALNSPQSVTVNLTVKNASQSELPFGQFATPIHGSTVRSSIAVTGWVLDDVEVMSVKIYNGTTFVGDAVFVEGARPDVEKAYPDYPKNSRAGWGYMLLTYFLPNGGNGTYTIHAKATDAEGHQVTLDSKTIICDNAHAVKPFGALDTPGQGGLASGSSFTNWGWVLTPQPNAVPTDGSTIFVYVDSVKKGSPEYNLYRSDIANFFPGYANSNGASGRFYLDTTAYENGVHTIQWTATDDAGNTDGIGSRFFTIQNTNHSSQTAAQKMTTLSNIFVDDSYLYDEPVEIKKGWRKNTGVHEVYPDDNGMITTKINELERVEIHLRENREPQRGPGRETPEKSLSKWTGYQVIGNQIKALPIGSNLDAETGVFCWQPAPGFLGRFHLVFVKIIQNRIMIKKNITLEIVPES